MINRLSQLGAEYDEEIAKRAEAGGKIRKALVLVPSMQEGKRLWHELTLESRVDKLKEGKEASKIQANYFDQQEGILLETLRVVGPYLDTTFEYYLVDEKDRGKRIIIKQSNEQGTITLPLRGRYSGRSVYVHIPPHLNPLPGVNEISTERDYLVGMENAIKQWNNMLAEKEIAGTLADSNRAFAEDILARLAAHLCGFGDAALRHSDVPTAAKSYQLGKVLETNHVVRNLERYSKQGPEQGISVRRTLKELGIA